ncbi:MAG: BadF/BadG/BcrA/BcrD type ATPase [Candidatus Aramenus sulfurataquae]|jgi:N-acetylglucosamine kinase-like BadF-type ATPase|uniref:ATPase n=2 Tax=Candidatus Aramenus sulfurataquae TaxID=1326980 RepID=W7KVZ4_9CREN|nr:MAG: BadF/BadG/BcrA/BcrD type ATPase [Candidatus Aramenus sulfurataquae]MCL7343179.1 ATPase [Candidatus Aramenus sulfurataquae]
MILVGVDAGGTSTGALAYTCEGKLIGYHVSGPGNYHNVGLERALKNIKEAIFHATNNETPDVVCIGLAGLDSRHDYEVLSRALYGIGKKVIIEHDSFIALYAETRGKPGVITIAGTGSVVVAYDGKKRYKYGGEGWLLSDDGSSYWMGRKALRTLTKMLDGRMEMTKMGEMLLKEMKIRDLDDLIKWAYHEGHKVNEIAGLAKVVDRAASEGDAIAKEIIYNAAKELSSITIYASRKISERKAYLSGGIFSSELYLKYFIDFLSEAGIEGKLSRMPAEYGAVLLAFKEAKCRSEPEEPPLHF